MTLNYFINTYPKDAVFYVGSESSFIWIGNKKQYAEEIDDAGRDVFLKQFNTQSRNLNDVISSTKTLLSRFYIDPYIVPSEKVFDYNCKLVERVITRMHNAYAVFASNYKVNELCESLRFREVLEYYPRFSGGIAVIIEGNERGNYWTREEVLNGGQEDD